VTTQGDTVQLKQHQYMRNSNQNKIKLLSFFTGGGFMDIGFEQAGFEIIWTNEVEPLFAEMYAAGINNMHKYNGNNQQKNISNNRSILKITSKEIKSTVLEKKSHNIFGIIGGPPCQDFSKAGNVQGFAGERGKLTEVFFERIYDLEPSFFVMENVESLWTIKKHRFKLFEILNRVKDKYEVIGNILNAIEYGVPQDRRRLFFVGFYRKIFADIEYDITNNFNWPNKLYDNPLAKYPWPGRSTYQGKPSKPKDVPINLCVKSCLVSENKSKVANANEVFKAKSDKFNLIEEGDTRKQSFKRLHRYRYSPTACYGNNEVHLHPYLPRRLSVREALRIQGVPDSYELPSFIGNNQDHFGLSAKFKMIGNGVPVPLAKHVGLSVKHFLETYLE